MSIFLWFLLLILSNSFTITVSSHGDRSQFYQICVENCILKACRNNGNYVNNPSIDLRLLNWSCQENCSYDCMWETVTFFFTHGFDVPQFHGKWPFIRIFGLQEPASVIFSLLNLISHLTMYNKFRKTVNSSTPMFYPWTYFTIICVNGWFWSTIFHARDTYFTEVMDYSCAFTIVLTLFYCLLLRISYKESWNIKLHLGITSVYLAILLTHLSHLWSGSINYGYNMKLNIAVGFLTFCTTMIWWYKNYRSLPHLYYLGCFVITTVSVTLLEVMDFPPIFWTFDAHSLWHASTAPLVIFLNRFITLDCLHLRNKLLKHEGEHLL